MSERWSLRLEAKPDSAVRERIVTPLVAYNTAAAGPGGWGLLAVTVRGEQDEIVGGLWGRIEYGYLFIEMLAMGPARGEGLGRKAMEMAEAEARERGLLGMWLDTWTFQAPGFYEKLGFSEFGRVTGYPPGHARIFYVKRLTA